jgi:very-short-patch-repair endonuclease
MTSLYAVDVVREHVQWAAEAVGQWASVSFQQAMTSMLTAEDHWGVPLESPLEAIFYIWWEAMTGDNPDSHYNRLFELQTQRDVTIGESRFRLDFVVELKGDERTRIEAAGLRWAPIAVEVDGHAFHEKTAEQVAHRNRRDRLLQSDGWTVFHFSWSELTTNPTLCVGEVMGAATARWQTLTTQLRAREEA